MIKRGDKFHIEAIKTPHFHALLRQMVIFAEYIFIRIIIAGFVITLVPVSLVTHYGGANIISLLIICYYLRFPYLSRFC